MSTPKEGHRDAAAEEPDLIRLPIAELAAAVLSSWRLLASAVFIGMLVTMGVTLLIPNKYTATAQLMPPDQQTISTSSALSLLSGVNPLASASSLGGGLLNTRTPAQTAIGILRSRTAQDYIIDRFDLKRIYHCKYYLDARTELSKRTSMDEDKKSGLVSISVEDTDKYRARDIVAAYIEELNHLLNQVNTSSSHLERVFLEQRLKSVKNDLDSASAKLSQFSSRNATLNPQTQGTAIIEAATKLQGELITAESELSGLKAQYSDDNVRVRTVRARIDELQSQLRKMGGLGDVKDGATLGVGELYPSIRQLPILGAAYSDIYRQMMTQENIYETLSKQYELSKVQEAKEIPTVKVLDEPAAPEKSSSPHRLLIVILSAPLWFFLAITWVVLPKVWEAIDDSSPLKVIAISTVHLIKHRA